ncbi:hypothetical protein ROTAS13_04216 [Roseomonas sp. TAS13]|uniref:hypothetical protein n=1 Tax=Roseomonas sp. TAS13 TaxID=1926319 RepID=UPI000968390B|nr:hypothetical protein [Roseomonas sp. TAS13]GAV36528.1 hypothetical protein ROTAS13_04216 [Roseomonas sp. TAS13]
MSGMEMFWWASARAEAANADTARAVAARQAARAGHAVSVAHDWRTEAHRLADELAEARAEAAGLRAVAHAYRTAHPHSPVIAIEELVAEVGRDATQ